MKQITTTDAGRYKPCLVWKNLSDIFLCDMTKPLFTRVTFKERWFAIRYDIKRYWEKYGT